MTGLWSAFNDLHEIEKIEKNKPTYIRSQMGEIYISVNEKNGKMYIGQAVCQFSNGRKWGAVRRWRNHVKKAERNICECRLIENAIRKHGADSFTLIIIHECPVEELNYWEEFYIRNYDTIAPKGYNLMSGGGNGRKHSDQTKLKMSITRTGKTHSELTKQRIGYSHKGKKISEKTRENIGRSSKFRNIYPENRQKIQEALKELDLKDLPMYIGYSLDKRYGRNVDIITVRGPNIKQRKFAGKKESLPEKIRLAIKYKDFVLQRSSV